MATSTTEGKKEQKEGEEYLNNPKLQKIFKLGEKDPEFLKKINNLSKKK